MMNAMGKVRKETQAGGSERLLYQNHLKDKLRLAAQEERVECSRLGKV